MADTSSKKPDFRTRVAEELIRHIEDGTASWMVPWKPGVIRSAPHNPTSGTEYRGINALWLEMQGRSDPRWMTYRQANDQGAQVRKGERGTQVEYWQFTEKRLMTGEDGKPLLDDEGKKRYQESILDRPRVFHAVVFNAEQIDGLAPLPVPELTFQPVEEAEKILAAGGVPIHHDQANSAFYRPGRDSIHLPPQAAFAASYEYYSTALHELGHATGHPSRLARDMSGPFGSESYAREELRAEIASYIVTTRLGLGHYPERHAGYVESWLKALKEDRNEIFRAARDAERAASWILEPEKRPALELAAQAALKAGQVQEQSEQKEQAMPNVESPVRFVISDRDDVREFAKLHEAVVEYAKTWGTAESSYITLGWTKGDTVQTLIREDRSSGFDRPEVTCEVEELKAYFNGVRYKRGNLRFLAGEAERAVTQGIENERSPSKGRVFLAVPYEEKDQAKAAGARWDRRAKSWYVPEGTDPAALSRWQKQSHAAAPEIDPRAEFAAALQAQGLVLKGEPVMDGKWHRVPVEGDGKGKQSGSYRGFLDGVPSGTIQNFKAGETVKWISTGNKPADLDMEKLKAEAKERAAERERELRKQQRDTAKKAYGIFVNAAPADPEHPYLVKKGVQPHGLKQDERGNLLVPLQDAKGFLWNVQSISPEGEKRFLTDGRKNGLMHGLNDGQLDLKHAKTIIVAEGYATAASIHAATGIPAVVAFDAGNLKPVAEAIRKANPQADIVIAADDDHKLEVHPVVQQNVGQVKAEEAAQAVGGRTIRPPLNAAERGQGLSDFNDLEAARGREAFQRILGDLMEPGKAVTRERSISHPRESALAM